MPYLRVCKAGLLTTIQDLGRFGLGRFGVPQSGAMDPLAFRAANRLVGNADNTPALEVTGIGPEIQFLQETSFSLAGGDLTPMLEARPLAMWHSHLAGEREVLRFGARRQGARCYLAVAGGFLAAEIMGSASTDLNSGLGGIAGGPLQAGLLLEIGPQRAEPQRRVASDLLQQYSEPFEIRFLPEEESGFDPAMISRFRESPYRVSEQSSRMGYRLQGPPLFSSAAGDMISDAIPPGTIQVPHNGEPILLMADGQGTGGGGYPRIGYVIRADLPKAGQLWIGNSVRFRQTTLEEARRALQLQESVLDRATRL